MAVLACIFGGITGSLGFLISWMVFGLPFSYAALVYFGVGLVTAVVLLVLAASPTIKLRAKPNCSHNMAVNRSYD